MSNAQVVDIAPPTPEELADPWRGADPNDPKHAENPYRGWNRLREIDPVNRTPLGTYRICRHADVTRVFKELKVGMRTTEGALPFTDESVIKRTFMLLQDPPDHTRLRKLVARAFTPPAVKKLQPEVAALVGDLLDAVQEEGEMDVVADLALPLPSAVICKMLRVPLDDRDKFTDWTAKATHGLLGDLAPREVQAEAFAAAMQLRDYFIPLIEARRSDLGDDLISTMIRAADDGDRLNEEELMTQTIGLLIAGFETTIGLIGNGVRQLILHPEQLERLRRDPSLVESAVEECLRFDGPIPATRRVLHEDAEIGGVPIPKNTTVDLVLGAAHRDPAVFDRPEELDVGRDPNPHFAFGGGIHYCLGAFLARLEAREAIGALVRRMPNLELVSEKWVYGPSVFRVPKSVPITFDA